MVLRWSSTRRAHAQASMIDDYAVRSTDSLRNLARPVRTYTTLSIELAVGPSDRI